MLPLLQSPRLEHRSIENVTRMFLASSVDRRDTFAGIVRRKPSACGRESPRAKARKPRRRREDRPRCHPRVLMHLRIAQKLKSAISVDARPTADGSVNNANVLVAGRTTVQAAVVKRA